MFTVKEDPNFYYEYYMREKDGEETRLSKEQYELVYNARLQAVEDGLVQLGDNLIKTSHIVKQFVIRSPK